MTESPQENAADEAALERGQFRRDWVGRISYAIFSRRRLLLIVFVLVTIALAAMASQLRVQAGFTKMLPLQHPYMQTFLKYQQDFGGANKVLVAVKARDGRHLQRRGALETCEGVHEDLFFMPGVERLERAVALQPQHDLHGGGRGRLPRRPGAAQQLPGTRAASRMRGNLLKTQWVGRIVASDFSAAMVSVTLLERDPETGERLDLKRVGADLETIRAKHEDAASPCTSSASPSPRPTSPPARRA